jgi:hypothetical protein
VQADVTGAPLRLIATDAALYSQRAGSRSMDAS